MINSINDFSVGDVIYNVDYESIDMIINVDFNKKIFHVMCIDIDCVGFSYYDLNYECVFEYMRKLDNNILIYEIPNSW